MSYESKRDAEWQGAAYKAARPIIRRRRCPFLAEEILPAIIEKVGEPADRRSMGCVIQWLRANGHIKRAGVGRARSSHYTFKPRWKAA